MVFTWLTPDSYDALAAPDGLARVHLVVHAVKPHSHTDPVGGAVMVLHLDVPVGWALRSAHRPYAAARQTLPRPQAHRSQP